MQIKPFQPVRIKFEVEQTSTDPRKVPGVVNEPMVGASVSGPLEHSVLKIDLDGGPMEGVSVLEPLEHSVLDISLDGGPIEGE